MEKKKPPGSVRKSQEVDSIEAMVLITAYSISIISLAFAFSSLALLRPRSSS